MLFVRGIEKLRRFALLLEGDGAVNHPPMDAFAAGHLANERVAEKPKGFVFGQRNGVGHVGAQPAVGPLKEPVPVRRGGDMKRETVSGNVKRH